MIGIPFISSFIFIILNIVNCQFNDYGSSELTRIILEIYKYNLDYFKIDTAQKRYNLPSQDCKYRKIIEEKYQNELIDIELNPCDNFILFVTDFNNYNYERKHIYIYSGLDGTDLNGSRIIIDFLKRFFIDDNMQDKWFKALLNEVVLVITPNTNAFGFANKISKEILKDKQLIDINEDFIYQNSITPSDAKPTNNNIKESPKSCLQTNTVKLMISLFREFNFILSMNIGNLTNKNSFYAVKLNPVDNYYTISLAEQFFRSTKEIGTNPELDIDISEVDKRINWVDNNNFIKAFSYMGKI